MENCILAVIMALIRFNLKRFIIIMSTINLYSLHSVCSILLLRNTQNIKGVLFLNIR